MLQGSCKRSAYATELQVAKTGADQKDEEVSVAMLGIVSVSASRPRQRKIKQRLTEL